MTDYSVQLDQIRKASTLDEIQAIAGQYSAKATGEGGILYSRNVGDISSEMIAKELAEKTSQPIINDTPRTLFLAAADDTIQVAARRIFKAQGQTPVEAKQSATDFLYGDAKAVAHSATSLDGCVWGRASKEFTGSLRGDVTLVASNANAERVFGKVELAEALQNNDINTLGGVSRTHLQGIYARGGVEAVLPEVQARFLDAAPKGVFVSPEALSNKITQNEKITKVTLSREFATTLNVDAHSFQTATELSASGKVVRAPIGMDVQVAAHEAVIATRTSLPRDALAPDAPVTRSAAAVESLAVPEAAERSLGIATLKGAGGVVMAAGAVYDLGTTTEHAIDLHNQGNRVASQSAVLHYGSRNLGMLGGAALGAEAGAVLGIESGPGALVTGAIGAGIGAFGGEKLAEAYDEHKIYNQTDPQGQTWHLDPKQPQAGWTRDLPPLPDSPRGQHFVADPALANRLTYQANGTAVELALGRVGTPVDPYTQPANAHDTESFGDLPWQRNEQSGQWQRTINAPFVERQPTPESRIETATPHRAAQLDIAAQQTIGANLASSQRGIAEEYKVAYAQNGWQQFGAMPEAVSTALKAPENTLQASNGHTYTSGANGQWTTPGRIYGTNFAEGNVRAELDATRLQQRALHGESSQVDRAQEAQRQQKTQGHVAAHEAPLSPAPAAISPGALTPEREAPASRQEPRPAVREQEAPAPTHARDEPPTATVAPDHAALAAQRAHQQAMHAQRQAQQEWQDDRAAPSRAPAPHTPGLITEAAALTPAVASVAPLAAASMRDAPTGTREPSQADRHAPAQAQTGAQRHEPTRAQHVQATDPTAVAASEHARAQHALADLAPRSTQPSEPSASIAHAVPHSTTAASKLSPPLDPPALKDFRHPEHPLNERYQMFHDALGEQGFHEARPTLNQAPEVRGYSAEQKDRLAAGFTAQVGSDRQFNTEIQHFRKDGDALLAIEHPERLGDTPLVLALSEKEALARSPEQHAAGWRARELPEPQAVDAQRPDPKSLSPEHPGHPDHPRNAMFEHAREALSAEYGRWGMQKGAEQLDRETMQVMTAARGGKMDDVGAVRLMPSRDEGKIGAFPTMQVFDSPDAPGRVPSTVFLEGQTLQQAPAVQQAAQQFQQVDQQATQQIQQNQHLLAQMNAQAPQAQGMGR